MSGWAVLDPIFADRVRAVGERKDAREMGSTTALVPHPHNHTHRLRRAWRRETPTREEGSLSLLGCGRMGGVEGWGAWGARSRDQQRPSMGARHASSPSPKKRSFLCADLALRQCYVIKIGSEAKKATTDHGPHSRPLPRAALIAAHLTIPFSTPLQR